MKEIYNYSMERNINYHLFKQQQFKNIYGVIIRPSTKIFELEIFNHFEAPDHILLSITSNEELNKVTKKVIQKLSPTCRNITNLDLSGLNLNDSSVEFIRKCGFKFIYKAAFTNNHLTAVGAKHIHQCQWNYLTELMIGDNPIKNKGLSYLCKSNWPILKMLNLTSTKITDDGVQCLAKTQWPKLHILFLSDNTLTNKSLKIIITCNFPNLTAAYFQDYVDGEQSTAFFNHNLIAKTEWNDTSYIARYTYMPKSFFKTIRHKTTYDFLQPYDDLSSSDEEY